MRGSIWVMLVALGLPVPGMAAEGVDVPAAPAGEVLWQFDTGG